MFLGIFLCFGRVLLFSELAWLIVQIDVGEKEMSKVAFEGRRLEVKDEYTKGKRGVERWIPLESVVGLKMPVRRDWGMWAELPGLGE